MERTKKIDLESEFDKVWVSIEGTINLGNYENIKINLGYSRSISEKEIASEIRQEITDTLLNELRLKWKELKKQNR
jgi:formiminotetrahydrofolate cyclodeaminase